MVMFKFIKRYQKFISATYIGVFILLGVLLASAVGAKSNFFIAEIRKLENKLPVLMWRAQLKNISQNDLIITWQDQDYIIKIIPPTKLLLRNNRKATLDEFRVGDYLQIIGQRLDKNVVVARYIHNSSLVANVKNVIGTVDNLDVAARQFTLASSSYGMLTVIVGEQVKILDRGEEKKLNDLNNSQKVIVRGWFDKSRQSISDVQKIVIFPN